MIFVYLVFPSVFSPNAEFKFKIQIRLDPVIYCLIWIQFLQRHGSISVGSNPD